MFATRLNCSDWRGASKDAYKSHRGKNSENAIAFHLLLCYLVLNHKGIASVGWTLCNTSESCTSFSHTVVASAPVTWWGLRLERFFVFFFFKFHIRNSQSRWPEEITCEIKLTHKRGFMWTSYTCGLVCKVILNSCLSQKEELGIIVKSDVNWPYSQNLSLFVDA